MNKRLVYGELCGGVQSYDNASKGGEVDNKAKLNILVGRVLPQPYVFISH